MSDVLESAEKSGGIEPSRTILPAGDRMGDLAALLETVLVAAGGRAPQTCLWIGKSDAFAEALADHIAQSGKGCAFFVADASNDGGSTSIGGAYAFPGPVLPLEDFPPFSDVADFAQTRPDTVEITRAFAEAKRAARLSEGRPVLDEIAEDFQLATFDLVVIAGEQVLTDGIVRRAYGSKAILIDGTKATFGGAAAFARLFSDTDYLLGASNDHEQGGWALFVQRDRSHSNLPVHFFTIVLNGEPFIRYHEQMLVELDCPWHWHVIEGVASLVKDTSWSVASGGHIPADLHNRGKSNDGTTEYLDDLKRRYPNRVTIYRKPEDVFWDGKLEMVSAPIPHIKEPCLLWQIDADELWTAQQVETVRRKFMEEPDRSAAYFWCNYFVGPEKGISTRYNYAQNPDQEWLRVWRFEPGMIWDKHEPPVLAGFDHEGNSYDVGRRAPFTHREMEHVGAVFDHFAYCTPEQAQFKESYYGYASAVKQWGELQAHDKGSGHLRDYFAWVSDDTMFDTVDRLGWAPLAYVDPQSETWAFRSADEQIALHEARKAARGLRIVVDGVFFQLSSSGIARVWINLMQEWIRSGFADNVVLLDRGKTAPRIDGVIYRTIDRHDWESVDRDARYLQEICDLEDADLFISTYYTTPTRTPSIFFGHDMIPERMGVGLDDLWWRQKRRAIQYAAGHIMVSQSSANDMCAFHPDLDVEDVLVAHNSVSAVFHPCDAAEIKAFREKYELNRPFVMLVGERFGWQGYKNGGVVFAALAQIPEKQRPLLVCVGGQPELEPAGRAFLGDNDVRILALDDDDLRACYGAALAYICPSLLEGFGLPIAEAMTVGCPALVCRNSSIPEVAGDAGIYFDANDPGSLVDAIEQMRDSRRRSEVIAAGKQQVTRFDQVATARKIADYCVETIRKVRAGEIRVQAQALEDVFRDAEALRAAEAGRSALEDAVFDLKRDLSASSRILTGEAFSAPVHVATAPIAPLSAKEPDTSLMIAMERRLAAAYAKLRSHEEAMRTAARASIREAETAATQAQPATAAKPRKALALVDTAGLTPVEGPYPQAQVERQFRWQVEPRGRYLFDGAWDGEAVFEFDFSNLEPDQALRIFVNDALVGQVQPPEKGWNHVWHLALPVTVSQGEMAVVVEADRCSQDESGPARYIAVYGTSIRPLDGHF